MRALIVLALGLALVLACSGSGAPVATPSWARSILALEDPDVVVALSVERLRDDPILGSATARLAKDEQARFLLRATQIDLAARVDDGEPRTWIGAVHGLGAPGEGDVPRLRDAKRLASGATEYRYEGRGALVVFPDTWVFAEGPALDRVRAMPPERLAPISMHDGAILEATVRAHALPRPKEEVRRVVEGLREATLVVMGGDRLGMIVRARYVDSGAAAAAEDESKRQLASFADRYGVVAEIVKDLVRIDLRRSDDVVVWHVEATDKFRAYLQAYVEKKSRREQTDSSPAPPPAPEYGGACAKGERWDLDRRACVRAP
jgi:hypothetical protein